MSSRKLGGGRVLGSGKGLTPLPSPAAARATSPNPPSESTVSLGSSPLSPPTSGSWPGDLPQDLGSSISVGAQSKGGPSDGTALVCPICSEEMLTLLQLNRHIDDSHQELPEDEQVEVKTWFDKQVLKAKRFQPLSVINQKLRGLEVFETNESLPPPPAASAAPSSTSKAPLDGTVDPEELITRSHWQRTTGHDLCTEPACGKGLGPLNGSINCRHCGRLFCSEHTMYQMRLGRNAKHDPVRGCWARVCETCYKLRAGYNEHSGLVVDHTDLFSNARRKTVERQNLEVARLEKRLVKLMRVVLANSPEDVTSQSASLLPKVPSFGGPRDSRKQLEQSVVIWEDDSKVSQCPFCRQEFRSWTLRRHHCRICGRVICADPQTQCSSDVALRAPEWGTRTAATAATPPMTPMTSPMMEKPPSVAAAGQLGIHVRMCRECKHTIFSKRDFDSSLAHKPADQRAYETLCQFERGIRLLLPSFHRVLMTLQPEKLENGEVDLTKPPPTHAQIQEAAKIRRRLVDSFTKYGAAAKRMRDLKASTPTQRRLQAAVYAYASSFLHTNMLPLKSLPQMLRSRSTPSASRILSAHKHSSSGLRHTELASTESETGSQAPSEGSSTVMSQLELEEKDLRERLVVLEEQRLMVDEMTKLAKERRRFEEVAALVRNGEELDGEIRVLRTNVSHVEERWEDIYRDGASMS